MEEYLCNFSEETHALVLEHNAAIVQDNHLLLQNKITKDLVLVPLSDGICHQFKVQMPSMKEEPAKSSKDTRVNVACDSRLWTKCNTLYLIEKLKENDEEFANGIKKNVWNKIAVECQAKFRKPVSATMCETKWKSLKRTYKTMTMNNKSTGEKRRYWEFYAAMHDIMYSKPEITPTATCSSISGLHIKDAGEVTDRSSSSSANIVETNSTTSDTASESSFAKKRKLKVKAADERHKEKMQRLDRFNDLFAQMVQKM